MKEETKRFKLKIQDLLAKIQKEQQERGEFTKQCQAFLDEAIPRAITNLREHLLSYDVIITKKGDDSISISGGKSYPLLADGIEVRFKLDEVERVIEVQEGKYSLKELEAGDKIEQVVYAALEKYLSGWVGA